MELSVEIALSVIGAIGAILCVWFGHWLTMRKVGVDAKNFENAYYIEMQRILKMHTTLSSLNKEMY